MSLTLLSWPRAGFLSSLSGEILGDWSVELLCFCKKPKRYIKTYLPARLQPHQPSGKLVLAAPHPPQFWRNSKVRIQTQLSASMFFDSRWMNLLLWLTLNTESHHRLLGALRSLWVWSLWVWSLWAVLTNTHLLESWLFPSLLRQLCRALVYPPAEVRQNVTQLRIFEML